MFEAAERERIKQKLIEKAHADPRIVAAAAVGSTATGGDRWSDLDLTFAVAADQTVATVMDEWTREIEAEYGAAILFDIAVHSTVYRVFLFPGALQVDLSFAPAPEFGSRGPRFHLFFGDAIEHPSSGAAQFADQFGLGVHHAVRAHICIERGRNWQALHWINELRDLTMTLACQRLGLDTHYGRGFDHLPPDVQVRYLNAIAGDLSADALRRALAVCTQGLLDEGAATKAGPLVRPMLREIVEATTAG